MEQQLDVGNSTIYSIQKKPTKYLNKPKKLVPLNQTELKKHTALHTAKTKNGSLPS